MTQANRRAKVVQDERAPHTVGCLTWLHEDVERYVPPARPNAAVTMRYLHRDAASRRVVVRNAATALADGRVLLVVDRETTSPTDGSGAPSNPDVLFSAADVVVDLAGLPGLTIRRAERERRSAGEGRIALDALVEVVRAVWRGV